MSICLFTCARSGYGKQVISHEITLRTSHSQQLVSCSMHVGPALQSPCAPLQSCARTACFTPRTGSGERRGEWESVGNGVSGEWRRVGVTRSGERRGEWESVGNLQAECVRHFHLILLIMLCASGAKAQQEEPARAMQGETVLSASLDTVFCAVSLSDTLSDTLPSTSYPPNDIPGASPSGCHVCHPRRVCAVATSWELAAATAECHPWHGL